MTDAMKKTAELAGKAHAWSAEKLLQYVGGLFMEQKDADSEGRVVWIASLGRTAFWVVFAHVMWTFHQGGALAAEELNVFYALLGYQGVKLGKDAMAETVTAWKGGPE